MDESPSFGAWLRRRRKALDLTQEALAQLVGCSVVSIRKFEGDEQPPSRAMAERLAVQLQIPAADHPAFVRYARGGLDAAPPALPTPAAQLPARAEVVVEPPATAATHPNAAPAPAPPITLPSGTVTFLFTDLVGSTRLWEQHPQAMQPALARHDAILHASITAHNGAVVKTTGDGLHAAFARATDALAAAHTAQQAIAREPWGATGALQVRMALHSGMADERAGDYYGPVLNRAARLLSVAQGGQVLLSRAAQELVCDHLPPELSLRDLGERQLRDLSRPEQLFQLLAPGLPDAFPPFATSDSPLGNLPTRLSSFVGRANERRDLLALLRQPDVRLLTLTGPGGAGKTSLAIQIAGNLATSYPDGVWFVDLAPISDPDLMVATIAQVLEVREASGQPLMDRLRTYLRDKQLLLVLDNFEQVVAAALLVGALLADAPQLIALVTSREPLHLAGEREYAIPPLQMPDPHDRVPIEQLLSYDAMQLFVARARGVKADFVVTSEDVPAIVALCGSWMGCRWRLSWRRRGSSSSPLWRCWRGSISAWRC